MAGGFPSRGPDPVGRTLLQPHGRRSDSSHYASVCRSGLPHSQTPDSQADEVHYAVAQEAGTVHSSLNRMFQNVFTTAKNVRTHTTIGENPVSVAYAAVTLSRQIFSDLSTNTALLIGAGETIELVAQHLQDIGKIIIANRTLERALRLADKFDGEAILLADIPEYLHRADIVIASTASQLPILGKGAVEKALKQRRHAPMFMVDIAVPRDIESQVGKLADVYLYTVDDLKAVIEDNVRSRQEAARRETIILRGADDFLAQLRSLDAVDIVRLTVPRQRIFSLRSWPRLAAAGERQDTRTGHAATGPWADQQIDPCPLCAVTQGGQ